MLNNFRVVDDILRTEVQRSWLGYLWVVSKGDRVPMEVYVGLGD